MTFALRKGVSVSYPQSGAVVLDERNGVFWQLNGTGVLVLKAVLAGSSRQDVVDILVQAFDINATLLLGDVDAVLADLTKQNLLETVG